MTDTRVSEYTLQRRVNFYEADQAGIVHFSNYYRYIGLAEAAKYQVPSVGSWVLVESLNAFAQFTIYGALVGYIQRPTPARITVTSAVSS